MTKPKALSINLDDKGQLFAAVGNIRAMSLSKHLNDELNRDLDPEPYRYGDVYEQLWPSEDQLDAERLDFD